MSKTIREENSPDYVSLDGGRSAERKLIEAAQGGDKKAFGLLIRQNQRRLFRFVYGLVGSFDVAEDIVQEAFVKVYTVIKSFQTERAF